MALSGRRLQRTPEEKRRIVEATFVPGASIAGVAREHGVNANQVFQWRYEYRKGTLGASQQAQTRLVPVTVTTEPNSVTLLGIAPEAAQRGERANSHVCSLSGLGRSSVETREPSIVDKGGEIPKKIEVPTKGQATQRTKHILAGADQVLSSRQEPPDTERSVRWCGRSAGGDPAPYPIADGILALSTAR